MVDDADTAVSTIYAGSGTLACSIQAPGFYIGRSDQVFIMKQHIVRTAMFNGRKYSIYIRQPVDGMTDTYSLDSQNAREMNIFADITTKNGLVTLVHEALHAENWTASEEVISRVSTEIGSFLWRLGYRRPVE